MSTIESKKFNRSSQRSLYLDDTYLFTQSASVIDARSEKTESWIALDVNIFHAQGGGQPSDEGTVDGCPVRPRILRDGDLVVLDFSPIGRRFTIGDPVVSAIDGYRRLRLAALHTAGHLIAGLMGEIGFTLTGNNHFPGESRIEFIDDHHDTDLTTISEQLAARIQQAILERRRVWAEQADGQRIIHIDGAHDALCGGTHVRNLGDLAQVHVASIRAKRGNIRVRYDAHHVQARPWMS
jgi:Ser-tRNA(Ala) deacylase AlaX